MKIEVIKLAELKPLEENVRRHTDVQIKELIRSINQFGQTRAIVIDEDNNILIGNGLYEAMVQRGDEKADCYRLKGLSEKEKKKLILTDNKVYSLGVDDYGNIEKYIQEITTLGDFDIAGFDEDILKEMTRSIGEVSNDVMNYGINLDYSPVSENHAPTHAETGNVADTGKFQPQTEHNAMDYQKQEVRTERTIVCPNCGEVIHID